MAGQLALLRPNANDIIPGEIGLVAQRSENGPWRIKEVQHGVELGNVAVIHDQNPVIIGCDKGLAVKPSRYGNRTYGVKSMSYTKHSR